MTTLYLQKAGRRGLKQAEAYKRCRCRRGCSLQFAHDGCRQRCTKRARRHLQLSDHRIQIDKTSLCKTDLASAAGGPPSSPAAALRLCRSGCASRPAQQQQQKGAASVWGSRRAAGWASGRSGTAMHRHPMAHGCRRRREVCTRSGADERRRWVRCAAQVRSWGWRQEKRKTAAPTGVDTSSNRMA